MESDSQTDSSGQLEIDTTKTRSQEVEYIRLFVTSDDPLNKFVMGCKSQDTILSLQNIIANQYCCLFEQNGKTPKIESEHELYKANTNIDPVRLSLHGFYLPPYGRISHLLHDGDTIQAHIGEIPRPDKETKAEKPEQHGKKSAEKNLKKEHEPKVTPRKRGRPRKIVNKDDVILSDEENDENLKNLLSPEVARSNENEKVDWILGSILIKKVKKASDHVVSRKVNNKPNVAQRQRPLALAGEGEFLIGTKKAEPFKIDAPLPSNRTGGAHPRSSTSPSDEETLALPKKPESFFGVNRRSGLDHANGLYANDPFPMPRNSHFANSFGGFSGLFRNGSQTQRLSNTPRLFEGGFDRPSLFKPAPARFMNGLNNFYEDFGEENYGQADTFETDGPKPQPAIGLRTQVRIAPVKKVIKPNKQKAPRIIEEDTESDIDDKIIPMKATGKVTRKLAKLTGSPIPEPASYDRAVSKPVRKNEGSEGSRPNAEIENESSHQIQSIINNLQTSINRDGPQPQTIMNLENDELKQLADSTQQRPQAPGFRNLPSNRSDSFESEIDWLQRKPQKPRLVNQKTSDVSDTSPDEDEPDDV